jgi:hypothetical protein
VRPKGCYQGVVASRPYSPNRIGEDSSEVRTQKVAHLTSRLLTRLRRGLSQDSDIGVLLYKRPYIGSGLQVLPANGSVTDAARTREPL